jgi:hypothetical protein
VTPTTGRLCGRSVLATIRFFVALAIMLPAGCDYGRMYDQDSVKTYERKMAAMDKRTIPVEDGFQALSKADPQGLKNPLPHSVESAEQGRLAYSYFCVQCHGPRLDGNGTVGQSFSPLPSNLTSRAVLSQGDGAIYAKIRLGFKRHPVLFPTVSARDGWAVIAYMRSVKEPP